MGWRPTSREWVAVVYHHKPHTNLVDPHLPKLRMSPATMFQHGIARAGYIEVPRDPDLGYEFLKTEWRTIQHYGVEIDGRRYQGPVLKRHENETSPYTGKGQGRWPIQVDPDDKIAIADLLERWHVGLGQTLPERRMALRLSREQAAIDLPEQPKEQPVSALLGGPRPGGHRSLW